jgi:RNA polymerase sigma factor for flagellar operon FliA
VSRTAINCLRANAVDAVGSRSRRQELARRYRRAIPGSAAEGELVEKHLPLVKTVVGRIAMTLPPHVDAEDLYSAGVVGLLQALRNFDEKNGASFATYARIRIQGAVLDELRRMDWQSRSMRERARKVQTVIAELEQRKGRCPTEEEVAAALKISVAEYEALLEEIRPVTFVCLDAMQGNGDDDEAHLQSESIADPNQVDPVENVERRELARLIASCIDGLPEMQRKVLALYYYEDLRLREIAAVFGLTESRICQIHAQAILAVRAFIQNYETRVAG